MVRGLRTPVCSPRYEIGWDHFDASMSSYISLSLPLFLSPNALKTSLTPLYFRTYTRTYTNAFARLCVYVCVCVARIRSVRERVAGKYDITRTPFIARMCAHGNGVREIAPAVFNAEADFLNRCLHSPTAILHTRSREYRAAPVNACASTFAARPDSNETFDPFFFFFFSFLASIFPPESIDREKKAMTSELSARNRFY